RLRRSRPLRPRRPGHGRRTSLPAPRLRPPQAIEPAWRWRPPARARYTHVPAGQPWPRASRPRRVRRAPSGSRHWRSGWRRSGTEREVRIETQVFTLRDWLLLFGAFLVSGGTYFVVGLVVWVLRPRAPLGRAFLSTAAAWGIFLITAMDLYGPATFFRLHVICETAVPPAVLHMALLFPQPHRLARWRVAGYAPALVIGALYERFLYQPAAYSTILYTNMTYLGVAGIFFGARLLWEYWQGVSPLARQRVRMVMLGTLCGFSIPSTIVLASVATGGGVGMNAGAFTFGLLALSLASAS